METDSWFLTIVIIIFEIVSDLLRKGNCVRYFLFLTPSFVTRILIADQICLGDVFVVSSPLDRLRHSLLEINIFSAGTNTWFLTIDHRSITNLVQDLVVIPLLIKGHLPASLPFLAKKIWVRGGAAGHVYWKKICQRNLR